MKMVIAYTGPIGTNTYVVYNEISNKAFIVDPAGEVELLKGFLNDNKLTLEAVLLTHGHYDHILAVADFQKLGAKVYMHPSDVDKIKHQNIPGFESYGITIPQFTPDVLVHDNDVLNICGYKIKVMHTPGHSEGSVSYILDNIIFCGDTIFRASYGRCDFPDGSINKIKKSIKRLLSLEGDYVIYSGHGSQTSAEYERVNNLIFRDEY